MIAHDRTRLMASLFFDVYEENDMTMHLRQRAVLMLFSFFCFFSLIVCLSSCSHTASNLKKLDEVFSAGDYAGTMEMASQYLHQDLQCGYLLYKGVSASFLGLPDESSRCLELYLAMAAENDGGRPLALRTLLDVATQTQKYQQVVSVAYELEDIGQGTQKSRMELYKALIATNEQEQADKVLNDLLATTLTPKPLSLLAVDAKAATSLLAASLEMWFDGLAQEDAALFLSTYAQAVELVRFRSDGGILLAVGELVHDSGLYQDVRDASLVALCLGDLYAASGQKVLARRFWNEAVKLNGNITAQGRLAAL